MEKHLNPTTLHQICNLIPPHLVAKLAREHGTVKNAPTYSHWSHVVTLIYAQVNVVIEMTQKISGSSRT